MDGCYIFIFIYRRFVMEILGIIGIVAAWYVLNRWILPRLGVQT